jgi:hypothetical protein
MIAQKFLRNKPLILIDKFLRLFGYCFVVKVDMNNNKLLDIIVQKVNKDYYKSKL